MSSEMLGGAQRWEHRLGTSGVSVEVTLTDGRTIHSDAIRGVFNRLVSVPTEGLRSAHPMDRDYAAQELAAFFLSWLNALPPPMINGPTPQGLSGAWRHISEWIWLAAKAGLPTPDGHQTSQDSRDIQQWQARLVPPGTPVQTVFVVMGQVVGVSAPPEILAGCRRLASLAGTALLGIEFVIGPTGLWTVAGATPVPDLRLGGDALLNALTHALRGEREPSR